MADFRLDRGTLSKTDRPRMFEGVVARVHKPGDPLVYTTGPEHRDLDELQRIVEQLPGLPVVTYAAPTYDTPLSHPESLLALGAESHEIGRVMGGKVVNGQAVAQIYIHDRGALREIEDGTRELSLGYRCALDEKRFQRSIVLDHLSVVQRARCGPVCALRVDAAEGSTCGCVASSGPTARSEAVTVGSLNATLKIELDEKSKQVLDTLSQLDAAAPEPVHPDESGCACNSRAIPHTPGDPAMDLTEALKKLDEANAKNATLESEVTSLKKDAEAQLLELNQTQADLKLAQKELETKTAEVEAVKADAQAKVDAAQKARSDAEAAEFKAAVDARVELLKDAEAVGIEDFAAMTDRQIKVAIVKKVDDMDVEDTRSMDFVNGMYSGAMKRHAKAAASVTDVRTQLLDNRDLVVEDTTNPLKTEAEIRQAAEAKRKDRWR